MRAYLLALCLLFTACGDGVPTVTSSDTAACLTVHSSDTATCRVVTSSDVATCRTVHMYGDSITNQAGQTIEQFLPCYTVINHGADGTMARDRPVPVWDKEAVYTISYGTNECLNDVSVEDYRLSLNHILHAGIGQRIVLEAPWLVVDPRCNWNIEAYRQTVVDLGKLYGVPVVALDVNQDHVGEGIHPTQSHMQARAKLLAAEVLKL